MKSVLIAGGSLAGMSAARALRAAGFDGRVTVVGDETHPPYDRPPLSKSFLLGEVTEDEIALDDPAGLDLEWRPGVTATALRPALRSVELADGSAVVVDGVILATGARARRPWPIEPSEPDQSVPAGVHVLRTLDDARALRAELQPGARLVVVGAGYLGAEVASAARTIGLDVTVVEATSTPLRTSLGTQVGAAVAGLHAAHGVVLHVGVVVSGFDGTRRVSGVRLGDGRTLPADVVVLSVGAVPNVEWLTGSGLDHERGVVCDAYGMTGIANVVAVGDCASWHDEQLGRPSRLEHWTAARERASVAVASLLSGGTTQLVSRPPYVWSEQYGVRLQITGHPGAADSMTIEEGTLADLDFVAVYRRGDEVVGAAAIGHAGAFMRRRKQLAARPRHLMEQL